MLNKFRELRALNAFAKKQSVGMQRKLMLYCCPSPGPFPKTTSSSMR